MNAMIKQHGEWVYRVVLLGAVCVGLYLNSKYVTREEFGVLQKQVSTIATQFAVMVESNRVNDFQTDTIRDHEGRLRQLERPIR